MSWTSSSLPSARARRSPSPEHLQATGGVLLRPPSSQRRALARVAPGGPRMEPPLLPLPWLFRAHGTPTRAGGRWPSSTAALVLLGP
ncbi:hypothetical protein PR202_ga15525 [Eleusine coracana subsp. coracana]|uniref:Uncharacterized protein n=1 Tax=Eleusine coracana subsp. coracana TaxID=191504 RepID=A0AAV5CK28_ELECO|nr:hypothetical protein PR202_ga15525 [Eleusine coracana subsp. coracana]